MQRLPYRKYHIVFGKLLFVTALIEALYGMYIIGKYEMFLLGFVVTILCIVSLVFNVKPIRKVMVADVCGDDINVVDAPLSFEIETDHLI